MANVVIVDDEVTMLQMVSDLLRKEGHQVFPYSSGKAALETLESHSPDLVISDLNLEKSRTQGLDILAKARSLHPPAVVIVITGFGSVESAVEAMKKGAYDYLEKPFKLEDFKLCAQRALSYNKAISENIYLRKQLKDKYHFSQIIGTAPKMQEVFKLIERVADTDSTVLILGESGTGKELVARSLHFNSRRQFAPFIPVNCSSLPENLLESELFGHRKGAFTGAICDKKGLFEEADGGTIFLDEIGCMPLLLQSRLLRVLQDREVRRVGDNTSVYVNVRVLAATNAPLEKRIKDGSFREDLYYRLNVIPIMLPSLRERREDIPLIVAHYIRTKINAASGQTFALTRRVMEALCAYDWPGNVRELENVLQRGCALCEKNVVQLSDLPAAVQASAPQPTALPVQGSPSPLIPLQSDGGGEAESILPVFSQPLAPDSIYPLHNASLPAIKPGNAHAASPPADLKGFLREQELAYLNRTLTQTGGDKEKAAGLLGISLATLYRKLSGDESGS